MKYSAQYLVFPATFHVISRKIDYLWDSVWPEQILQCRVCMNTKKVAIHNTPVSLVLPDVGSLSCGCEHFSACFCHKALDIMT